MPLLSIEANKSPAEIESFLSECSNRVAKLLGKPESYVMVRYNHNPNMLFAGCATPTAFLQLKSLGLPEEKTAELSSALCALVSDYLSVPAERCYIEFSSPPRHMWGWNSRTF